MGCRRSIPVGGRIRRLGTSGGYGGGVFVPCNEKFAVIGWYRGVNVLSFIVQGESV